MLRTHSLLNDLKFRGVPGKLDFLSVIHLIVAIHGFTNDNRYVDEAQDNLLTDALCEFQLLHSYFG